MRLWRYLLKRVIFLIPQLLGVFLVTFIAMRMIPGDPARIMAGPMVSEEGVQKIRERMGWSDPIPVQFITYLKNIFRGDLGRSWFTGNPVVEDIRVRLPATLELILLALLVAYFGMLPIAFRAAAGGEKKIINRVAQKTLVGYGMAAGAFPDFWLGLVMIFVFYAVLKVVPAPIGQLDIIVTAPRHITGMYLVDSLLTGDWIAFKSHLGHLILPVFVLAFVYGGAILKVAVVSAMEIKKSGFIGFAKVCALPPKMVKTYITKATYPSVATMTAVVFGYLIGGAVLVEQVFSWGGFGMYAVDAVIKSDYSAIQGVVLVAAVLNLVVYVFVDLIYFWVDPRVETIG